MSSSARLLNLVQSLKQHVVGKHEEEQILRAFDYESAKELQLKCLEEAKKEQHFTAFHEDVTKEDYELDNITF